MSNACVECYRRKQKCDRKQPCSNCASRRVTYKCHYGKLRKLADGSRAVSEVNGTRLVPPTAASDGKPKSNATVESQAVDLGYSSTAGSNALVDFEQVFDKQEGLHTVSNAHQHSCRQPEPFAMRNAANARLPARMAVTKLIEVFFDDVNWQYFILEKRYFDYLVTCWYGINVEILPHLDSRELDKELYYFPALLFQVLGLAIQFLPIKSPVWEFLSQADMALCHRYSDVGMELMAHTQRDKVALATVQAEFLRASWLKNIGKGVDAWLSVGNAIRSAQELGLHRHKDAHRYAANSSGTVFSQTWYEEYKRRLWMNLCIWDTLTAMILGRPRAINPDDCDMEEPIECNIPQNPSTCVPRVQEDVVERDRPNPVSANLFLYRLSNVWHTAKALKADRPLPMDYTIVQKLHDEVNYLMDRLPLTLRHEKPDLSWDNQYSYLPQQREDILTKANLVLVALHRPHIKYRAESRRAALQAAIVISDSQQRSFLMAEPHQYQLFSLSFYTIDASLFLSTVAAGHLPRKNSEIMVKVDSILHQAMNRLSAMHSYSPIARSGLIILRRCYYSLQKRLEYDTTKLDPSTATATESKDINPTFGVNVVEDSVVEQQPHLARQQSPKNDQQESGWGVPTPPSMGCSTSNLPTIPSAPHSPQSGWTFDATMNPTSMPVSTSQQSLHLDLSTTDFDETYWLSMINEIPDMTSTDPMEAVEIGEMADAAFVEADVIWNQIHFAESST